MVKGVVEEILGRKGCNGTSFPSVDIFNSRVRVVNNDVSLHSRKM